jgi:enoyl-CoA hydratase
MSEVLYETADGITVITINRPERYNTMNSAMRDALFDAWQKFEADGSARVAILAAAGDKAFCAGRDLKDPVQAAMAEVKRGYLPILGDSVKVTKPVIAAVNGPAYGLGFIFVQMCDMCVASLDATFAVTEVKLGRGVPWAAPLTSMLSRKVLSELLLTSAPISAQRAQDVGLVNHVVPRPEVMTKAMELARAVVASAPLSVTAARQMIDAACEYPASEALDKAYEMFAPVYASEDSREGIRAYLEKRAPVWAGR